VLHGQYRFFKGMKEGEIIGYAVQDAVNGKDVVIHLAADPRPEASWDEILQSNMVGSYNVFEACRVAGVRRLVYASSVMVTVTPASTGSPSFSVTRPTT